MQRRCLPVCVGGVPACSAIARRSALPEHAHLTLNPHTFSSSHPSCTLPPSTGTPSSSLSSYRVVGRNSDPFSVAAVQNKILGKCACLCASRKQHTHTHTQEVHRIPSVFLKSTAYVTVTTHYVGLIVFWGVVNLHK